jgi:dolichol-phosphate mannosyltransferase
LELLGYTAAILVALSFCAFVHQGVDMLRHPEVALGTRAILVLIAFFGSLNLLAVTIVGEYVIKIFEEAKRRPKFIRKAIRHGGRHFSSVTEIDDFVRARARKTGAREEQQ